MLVIVELAHPSDPRYLLIAADKLPERISFADVGTWRYGKALTFAPGAIGLVYTQPDGFGTDWVRPTGLDRVQMMRERCTFFHKGEQCGAARVPGSTRCAIHDAGKRHSRGGNE